MKIVSVVFGIDTGIVSTDIMMIMLPATPINNENLKNNISENQVKWETGEMWRTSNGD